MRIEALTRGGYLMEQVRRIAQLGQRFTQQALRAAPGRLVPQERGANSVLGQNIDVRA
jgi:hypothetical protein